MVNCNPETVSTDYDTSDRLYFEPLTLEDVLAVCELERPEGVVVQFGGQTPLKLAAGLDSAGVRVLGTSIDAIDLAEDRSRFGALLDELGYSAPPYATASSAEQALAQAPGVGFPLLVRPSYVLGGRAMEIVYDVTASPTTCAASGGPRPGIRTIYLDRFLEDSIEVDVDALSDGDDVWIAGIMQHVEEAGSTPGTRPACCPRTRSAPRCCSGSASRPPESPGRSGRGTAQRAVRDSRRRPVRDRGQPACVPDGAVRVQGDRPAAGEARVPDHARRAARAISSAAERAAHDSGHVCVKEAVLPFDRFAGADTLLGPEMRSTGEVMGIAPRLPDRVREGPGGRRRQAARARGRRS